jgi:hypothetical protein
MSTKEISPLTKLQMRSDCYIAHVPNEILLIFFRYLSIWDQGRVTLVCKNWRKLLNESQLDYGRVFNILKNVLKMAAVEPEKHFVGKCNFFNAATKTIALFENHYIFDKMSGEGIRFDCEDALPKFSSLTSEDKLITVTDNGGIALWNISLSANDSKKVQKVASLQLFNDEKLLISTDEELQKIVGTKKFKIKQGMHAVFSIGNRLIVERSVFSPSIHTSNILFFASNDILFLWQHWLEIYDLPSLSKIANVSLFSQGRTISQPLNWGRKAFVNSNKIFFMMDKWDVAEGCDCLNSIGLSGTKILKETFMGTGTDYLNPRSCILNVNDQWLVLANDITHTESKIPQIVFRVFNPDDEHEIFTFSEDGFLKYEIKSWLCGDFFVILVGEELKVCHFLLRKFITKIDLEKIAKNGLNYSINNVEIYNDELHIFYQMFTDSNLAIAEKSGSYFLKFKLPNAATLAETVTINTHKHFLNQPLTLKAPPPNTEIYVNGTQKPRSGRVINALSAILLFLPKHFIGLLKYLWNSFKRALGYP